MPSWRPGPNYGRGRREMASRRARAPSVSPIWATSPAASITVATTSVPLGEPARSEPACPAVVAADGRTPLGRAPAWAALLPPAAALGCAVPALARLLAAGLALPVARRRAC